MSLDTVVAAAGALIAVGLAIAVIIVKPGGTSAKFFAGGMALFGAESICEALSFTAVQPGAMAYWQSWSLVVKSVLPGVWLCFSASYSRGDGRAFVRKWKWLLLASTIVPLIFALVCRAHLFELLQDSSSTWLRFTTAGRILNALLLLGTVVILMNLEQTFRSAVGTMRWRIKFLVLGVAVIFGVWIYTRSQILLFSGHDLSLIGIESIGLVLGTILVLVGYVRSGFGEVDLYPSRDVLQTSLTVLLVGGYLIVVGVLAQIAAYLGGAFSLRFAAFVILLGVVSLALLFLSEKARRRIDLFVSRHLRRPHYDFRKLWSRFTETTAEASDPAALSTAVADLLSETFHSLSVSIWLIDDETDRLVPAASTSGARYEDSAQKVLPATLIQSLTGPMDLDVATDERAAELRTLNRKQFREGGHQICVPLRARERSYGLVILSDRVSGMPYTAEEFDLLGCIADQTAARLVSLQASSQLLARKEFEALQRVTAFFVHDLKNATSTLSLMLTNLPAHFADPAFREDAMRGIRSTAARIDQLISRAGSLRSQPAVEAAECDLTSLISESLQNLNGSMQVEIVQNLSPFLRVRADREQLQSVITNLLLNAAEAKGTSRVTIETSSLGEWVTIKVSDNGCGMSPAFIRESLFRPFQTTKKKGLGIGLFQSKMIVENHRGKIFVTSAPGAGTNFRIQLPL